MKAFKRIFLAAALLSSVPVLTLYASAAAVVPKCADTDTCWHVMAIVVGGSDTKFRSVAQCDTRADAQVVLDQYRDDPNFTAVHTVPPQAFLAQESAGLAEAPGAYTCSR